MVYPLSISKRFKMKRFTIIPIILISFLTLASCFTIRNNDDNARLINDRSVNLNLVTTSISAFLWNFETAKINEVLEIEINRSDILAVIVLDKQSAAFTGRAKDKNEILSINFTNYAEYITSINRTNYEYIKETLIYENSIIGYIEFIFINDTDGR